MPCTSSAARQSAPYERNGCSPYPPASGGILSAQGAAVSNAAAARSTAASWRRRPTIWSPTGSPLRVNPHGTEIAGRPVSVMP